MTPRQAFALKLAAFGAVCFATAAAFSAYLQPGMLVEFANLVLCS